MQWNDLRSMTREELKEAVAAAGEKGFRADQIYGWPHRKLVSRMDEMVNVPASCRKAILDAHPLWGVEKAEEFVSNIDGTRKYLFALHYGQMVESVLMRYHHGNSVCISSQAGCRMGCSFCASTLMGLARNLTPAEMLDQIYTIQRETGERVSNVVVMGTGEPFDNYDALSQIGRAHV